MERRLVLIVQASFFIKMTSDHNRSELEIQDHINEPSSSKRFQSCSFSSKEATSRQEALKNERNVGIIGDANAQTLPGHSGFLLMKLGIICLGEIHTLSIDLIPRSLIMNRTHSISKPLVELSGSQAVIMSPNALSLLIFAENIQSDTLCIHNDEWISFQCHHQTDTAVAFQDNANVMSMLVQDTRSQMAKNDKDNDKGSKFKIAKHEEQVYNK
ncbi:hypothetical protein Tco_0585907 [Tanacetum coccineum]